MVATEAQKRAMRKYYLKNRERLIAKARKWQEENKELQREYARNCMRKRRASMTEYELEKERKRQREYYHKRKEEMKYE